MLLVSCRHTMSGLRSVSQATAASTRCLIEFTFQVATRMPAISAGSIAPNCEGRDRKWIYTQGFPNVLGVRTTRIGAVHRPQAGVTGTRHRRGDGQIAAGEVVGVFAAASGRGW